MLCGADNISRNIHMYFIRIQADLLHVTHVDTYVINQNSYVKSNVTFGLGDNSRKVRIWVWSVQSHLMILPYLLAIHKITNAS